MNRYFQTPPVVKNLIVVNALIYLAVALLPSLGRLIEQYGALWVGMPYFRSYQFVTYMFLHASFEHLFFNMFALWMFGRTLEYELGSKRFLVFYMVCGVGAALIQAAIAWGMHEPMTLVGASGAVMGLLLAFGVLHPNAVIMLLFPPVPLKAKWFVVIYGVIELLLGWRGVGNVAHFAHVGGMLWGLLLLWWWRRRGIIRF
ncbi:MAG: rhomboid family intramembrane serine protease [Bacteroides cellulosilyticus]|nr:rhomboid family intramembrane serine protease [Bacteroides cellulosilyticus]